MDMCRNGGLAKCNSQMDCWESIFGMPLHANFLANGLQIDQIKKMPKTCIVSNNEFMLVIIKSVISY